MIARPRVPVPNGTVRTTTLCAAGCGELVTVPGLAPRHIGMPLYCERCVPAGCFGPPPRVSMSKGEHRV